LPTGQTLDGFSRDGSNDTVSHKGIMPFGVTKNIFDPYKFPTFEIFTKEQTSKISAEKSL